MKIKEYTICSDKLEVKFLNLGATITEINYRGINRILKFEELNSYTDNTMYLGATVGRTAGRIKDGKIPGGQLKKNFMDKHNLHGNDLHNILYDVTIYDNKAVLKYLDPAGEYPGNLNITIEFVLIENSLLQIINADSDVPTVINFTNHTYFNLNGKGKILNHKLKIDADCVGLLDNEYIPIEFEKVSNTAFDFRAERLILESIIQGDKQFLTTGFIDHPYKLRGMVKLVGDDCTLKISTNQKYLVAYLGSQICNEEKKLDNNINENYVGLCLETQNCPGQIDLQTKYMYETKYTFEKS